MRFEITWFGIVTFIFAMMFFYLIKFQLEPWIIQMVCDNLAKCD